MARKTRRTAAADPALALAAPRGGLPALLLLPLLLAAASYARVLRGEFQLDDFQSIVQNPAIKDLAACARESAALLLRGAGRPVTELSFALDYAAHRLDPLGFHAVNLAVHLAVVVLVFLFTRRLWELAGAARAEGAALAVAGLFALHPLQSEAVSYVAQRSEVLASGFALAALLCFLAAERPGAGARGIATWLVGLALFTLGLGSKTIAVTVPAAWLLIARLVPDARGRALLAGGRRRLLLLAPAAAIALWFARGVLGGIRGQEDAGFSVPGLPASSYFLTQWRALVIYLRLLIWPAGQTFAWPLAPSRSLAEPAVLGAGLLLCALLAGAASLWRRGARGEGPDAAAARLAALGALWFFLVLSPTSSVVPLADLLFEHRVYLAAWGPLAAAVAGCERLLARLPEACGRPAARALTGAAWLALALALFQRNAVWETRVALWSDAAAKAPGLQRPHLNLAHAWFDRGDPARAIAEFHRALDCGGRESPRDEAFIQNNLAVALLGAGRADEARDALVRALALEPSNASAHANLALLLLRRQDPAGAEEEAGRALALAPDHGGALEVLGGARLARGDAAGALAPLERAVRADPDDGERWLNLATVNAKLGRAREACAALRQLARLPGGGALRERARAEAAAAGCPPH